MKILRWTFLAIMFVSRALGQVETAHFQNIVQSLSSGSAAYGSGFKGQYNVSAEVKGSPYLEAEFNVLHFEFYKSKQMLSAPARYNLLTREFEVQTMDGLRPLHSLLVRRYSIFRGGDSTRYVNARDHLINESHLDGFLEVVVSAKRSLYRHVTIEVIKPSYNPSLEVGDRDIHLEHKEAFYLSENAELCPIKSKKDVLKCAGSGGEEAASFIKKNNLNVKLLEDLIVLVKYLNTL